MTINLDDRKRRFEMEFQHEQELLFKIKARRNKIFAQWAAAQLGLSEDRKALYIKEVINFSLAVDGDKKALEKIMADLEKHKLDVSDHRVSKEYDAAFETAKKQLFEEI